MRLQVQPPRGLGCTPAVHRHGDQVVAVLEVADENLSRLAGAPAGGTVLEVNTELSDHPERVNEAPYENGWMLLIAPDAAGDFDQLLDAAAYQKLLDEQTH